MKSTFIQKIFSDDPTIDLLKTLEKAIDESKKCLTRIDRIFDNSYEVFSQSHDSLKILNELKVFISHIDRNKKRHVFHNIMDLNLWLPEFYGYSNNYFGSEENIIDRFLDEVNLEELVVDGLRIMADEVEKLALLLSIKYEAVSGVLSEQNKEKPSKPPVDKKSLTLNEDNTDRELIPSYRPQFFPTDQLSKDETRESKALAKQLETQWQEKHDIRQARSLIDATSTQRLFTTPSPSGTSTVDSAIHLWLTDNKSKKTTEFMLIISEKRKLDSKYFHIEKNKFILIPEDCIHTENSVQKLLFSCDGRGFLGEVSPGQCGIKLFRDGFAVIKGSSEKRIFCAAKTITLNDNQSVEIYVPIITVDNHHLYERKLTEKKIASRLTQKLNDEFDIQVGESRPNLTLNLQK